MTVNVFKPHVLVLPEDRANRELATGFELGVRCHRNIQVLPEEGGWPNVRNRFAREHQHTFAKYPSRHMILLVDFDDDPLRIEAMLEGIQPPIRGRTFVLGTKSEPEDLKIALGISFETIGRRLAEDCSAGSAATWDHPLLAHNRPELDRMSAILRPILFG